MHGRHHLFPDHERELRPDPGQPRDEPGKTHQHAVANPALREVVEAQSLVRLVIRAEDDFELRPDVVPKDFMPATPRNVRGLMYAASENLTSRSASWSSAASSMAAGISSDTNAARLDC